MRTQAAFTVNSHGTRHPGTRAIEPSADDPYAIRGRLYIVVELFLQASQCDAARYSATDIAQVNTQLLDSVRYTYYTAKGSQSQVTHAAIEQAHKTLHQINQQRPDVPFGAGICAAALLGNVLAIASSGPIVSLLASEDSVQQFPSTVPEDTQRIDGAQTPEIQIFQRNWHAGGSFFLGSAKWLSHIAQRELLGMVAHLTLDDVPNAATYVSEQSGFAPIPGLFVTVEGATQSTGTSSNAPSVGGLPTAVHATTHSQPQASQPSVPVEPPIRSQPLPPAPLPPAPDARRQIAPHVMPPSDAPKPRTAPLHFTQSMPSATEVPAQEDVRTHESAIPPRRRGPSLLSRVGSAVGGLFQRPGAILEQTVEPPDFEARAYAEHSSVEAPRADRPPMMTEAEYAESKGWGDVSDAQPIYIEPKPATDGRARLFLFLAALILVLVPLIVFASVMSQGVSSRAKAESLIDAATAQINSAETALTIGDKGLARSELTQAEKYLQDAESLKGDRNQISQLKARVQQHLQAVLQIVPLYMLVEPLVRFPADASPSRVMIVNQDVYILDSGRSQILRLRLDANGESIPNQEGDVVLRQGDRIDGVDVGPLIDMAWQTPNVGNEEKSNLIVLDSNNQVFRFNQTVDGASRIDFGGQGLWQSPSQIESYIGRFYIADGGRGQVYRYEPGNFGAEPFEWLQSPAAQSLSGVLSMHIDGGIWMLFSNGQLLRYHGGLPQPFALDSDVGQITEPVDMFIGDQEESLIYLADAGKQRILVFTKEGSYLRQYQAAEGAPLRDLRGVHVDEITGKIYLLTKSSLFQHPLSE